MWYILAIEARFEKFFFLAAILCCSICISDASQDMVSNSPNSTFIPSFAELMNSCSDRTAKDGSAISRYPEFKNLLHPVTERHYEAIL